MKPSRDTAPHIRTELNFAQVNEKIDQAERELFEALEISSLGSEKSSRRSAIVSERSHQRPSEPLKIGPTSR